MTQPRRPFTLATRDGLDLIVESWRPQAASAPPSGRRVLVVHGYGEHHGRYAPLARELTEGGHEVHLFDLRGHGESEGRRGHVDDFAEYRRDVLRVAEHVGDGDGAPDRLDLVAHSLGGLIALDAVLAEPERFASLTLSDPFLAPGTPLPFYARKLAKVASRFLPDRTFASGIDLEALTRDETIVRAYRDDPKRVSRVTGRWLLEVLSAQERVAARAGEVTLPLLMLLGGADTIASVKRSKEVFSRAASEDKRLVVYDGFRHEIFNELGRERVVEELLGWLSTRRSA